MCIFFQEHPTQEAASCQVCRESFTTATQRPRRGDQENPQDEPPEDKTEGDTSVIFHLFYYRLIWEGI